MNKLRTVLLMMCLAVGIYYLSFPLIRVVKVPFKVYAVSGTELPEARTLALLDLSNMIVSEKIDLKSYGDKAETKEDFLARARSSSGTVIAQPSKTDFLIYYTLLEDEPLRFMDRGDDHWPAGVHTKTMAWHPETRSIVLEPRLGDVGDVVVAAVLCAFLGAILLFFLALFVCAEVSLAKKLFKREDVVYAT